MSMAQIRNINYRLLGICTVALFFTICLFAVQNGKHRSLPMGSGGGELKDNFEVVRKYNEAFSDLKALPYIFVGGFPRSGTTLMRVMLDAHPMVRCGEETRIVPRALFQRNNWLRDNREHERLQNAGVSDRLVDDATLSFVLKVVIDHGKPANRYCNKDPFALKSLSFLHHTLPNTKFILMIRDGRASVHSMIERKVTITNFNLNDFGDCLRKWNQGIQVMYDQCIEVGREYCLPIYYEYLILHPEETAKKLIKFLGIPWNDTVLHHEEFVNVGDTKISPMERSSDQVNKPIYTGALKKFVGHVPQEVEEDLDEYAPMIQQLGYDPSPDPNYELLKKPKTFLDEV